ncbi:MAG: zinc ABC transporter solute-binding protein [Saprospiraceae bacterium]|nr:zinc ABC transporter substrate-binding protein [Bacteroidia bacterium]NNE13563.1 zinc ABC transporter solute-binding protein [Saprospiraceae bacterium]NNL93061.1 zinc ABC transporter solute-binding protein [Saprospiraceae bacterium]
MKSFFLSLLMLSFGILKSEKPLVVCSASMIYDMVKEIGSEALDIKVIVPIGGDPHLYNPTPSDATLVSNADLIFINGLTFEGWILELIENSGTSAAVDTVTNGVAAIQSGKYQNAFDPHAWMDVSNGLVYIKNIKNSLIKLDPENKGIYEKNYDAYKSKLESLDKYIEKRILEIPEAQRVLITSHDAFAYYGKRYGLQLEAIQGMSTEAEAQTSDIIRIVNVIKKTKVPAIFIESTISPKLIQQIASDNNVAIGGELFADSIGDKDSGANSYYLMLKKNTDTIVEALKGEKFGETKYQHESESGWLLYGIIGLSFLLGIVVLFLKLNK